MWLDGFLSLNTNFMEKEKQEIITIQVCFRFRKNAKNNTHYFTVPDNALDDGTNYSFQVSSFSTNGYETYSNIYEISTPHHRVVLAITIGTSCLMVLLCVAAVTLYFKRSLFASYVNKV